MNPLRVFPSILVVLLISILTSPALAESYDQNVYPGSQEISFSQLRDQPELQDALHTLRLASNEISLAKAVVVERRPGFAVVYLSLTENSTFFGIVPRKGYFKGQKFSKSQLVDQQVVQWEVLDRVLFDRVKSIAQYDKYPGQLFVNYDDSFPGSAVPGHVSLPLSKLYIPEEQPIQPISRDDIVTWAFNRPLRYQYDCEELLPAFLGAAVSPRCRLKRPDLNMVTWNDGILPELSPLVSSTSLLDLDRVIVPGKEKTLHKDGTLFTARMTVNENSPYSGHFAPGEYFIFGRLSSGMKDLNLFEEDGVTPQTNSLAYGFMVFKTQDQKEVPAFFMTQDTLNPKRNHGLGDKATTNNPRVKFSEIFTESMSWKDRWQLLATGAGVFLSSAQNPADSARGVRANFRSMMGATRDVKHHQGEAVVTPPHIAMTIDADSFGPETNYVEYFGTSRGLVFNLFAFGPEGTGHIATIHDIDWFGFDSHEISFPHSRSGLGAIDPNTLRASFRPDERVGLFIPNNPQVSPPAAE